MSWHEAYWPVPYMSHCPEDPPPPLPGAGLGDGDGAVYPGGGLTQAQRP